MDRDANKVVVQLLRLVVRPNAQTMIATFRCADGSTTEMEMTAECARSMSDKQLVSRALNEFLLRTDPGAAAATANAVPSVAIKGCKVLVHEEGLPALLFDVAGTSQFAVQLCQKSAAALIGQLTEALNAQPPPGKRH